MLNVLIGAVIAIWFYYTARRYRSDPLLWVLAALGVYFVAQLIWTIVLYFLVPRITPTQTTITLLNLSTLVIGIIAAIVAHLLLVRHRARHLYPGDATTEGEGAA